MYVIAIFFGIGNSLVMVTGVGKVNDLVGDNVSTSAFVYGCMSFTDKLSSGVVVLYIQNVRDSKCDDETGDVEECGDFVRDVMTWVPIVSVVVACLVIVALGDGKQKRGK